MSVLRMAGFVPGLSSLLAGSSWPSFRYRLRTGRGSSGWILRVGFKSRGLQLPIEGEPRDSGLSFSWISCSIVEQMAATSVVWFFTFVRFFSSSSSSSSSSSGMAMPRHSRKDLFPTC